MRKQPPTRVPAQQLAALLQQAWDLHQRGDTAAARKLYRRILKQAPEHPDTLHLMGLALLQEGQPDKAVAHLRKAVAANPSAPHFHLNLANAYAALGNPQAGIRQLREVLRLAPDYVDAWYNLGNAQDLVGDSQAALESYARVLHLAPDHPGARTNRGLLLKRMGQLREAVDELRQLVAAQPGFGDAWVNLGNCLRELQRPGEAAAAFEQALRRQPERLDARVYRFWVRQEICDWRTRAEDLQRLLAAVDTPAECHAIPPFAAFLLPLDPGRLQRVAVAHAQRLERDAAAACPGFRAGRPARRQAPERLRIGYLSADFHDHPTAHLMRGLFAAHDRERFEVFAYSYGPADESAYRREIEDQVERFRDVRTRSLCERAAAIAADGLHILLDLKGYTKAAQPELLALRPAPIQVNYLGFPGTMGAGFMDYFVTDEVATPPGGEADFSERLVYLPGSYQVNDDRQPIAATPPARAECGLPARGFVFCCFNQAYKIAPDIFDCWMRLLRELPESVLWLFRSAPEAEANLREAARQRAVDPQRLVFAQRLPKPEHLARHVHADLFLDTPGVNAHTTASDALWAGLPVLTYPGTTFVSRVAASLLSAVGLPELIVDSLADYERLALRLATDPEALGALRYRLAANRLRSRLFATARYVRNLEQAYVQMWARYRQGQPPGEIRVAEVEDAEVRR